VAIVAIAVATVSVGANAQETGDMAVGGKLLLNPGSYEPNFGIGAKFQYNVTVPIRLEASASYFLPKTWGVLGYSQWRESRWDVIVNGHWLFPVSDKITLYPLAGLGVRGWVNTWEGDDSWGILNESYSSSSVGAVLNLGGGLDLKLTDKLLFNAEVKLFGELLSVGVTYKL
jgi:outer membrane protein X